MEMCPELVLMVTGLIRSLKSVWTALLLVFLMTYTWGLVMTTLLKTNISLNSHLYAKYHLHFESLIESMWTLFVNGALVMEGSGLMTTLLESEDFMVKTCGFLFLMYLCLASLMVMQMLIGIICEVISHVNQERQNDSDHAFIRQQIWARFQECDDGDGLVNHKEFWHILMHKDSRDALSKLNINLMFLLQMQKLFYPEANSRISFEQVMGMMMMCRGDQPASVGALAGGFSYVAREVAIVRQDLKWVAEQTCPSHAHAKVLEDEI